MERAGKDLNRVFTYWGIWSSNTSSPEFRAIQQEMAPQLSAFFSKINQNEKLFARVKAVYESEAKQQLRPDQQRLVELVYNGFARNGATLAGLNGIVIKSHGGADAYAFQHAIDTAIVEVRKQLPKQIGSLLEKETA